MIGSHWIKDLLNSLNPKVREKVGRCVCNITFRFGNLSTLESQQALVIPLGRLRLRIAVVPGKTPFLISNTLARALKAQIDTDQHRLHSPLLKQSVKLHLTPKGLFLIDVNQLAMQAECQPGRLDQHHSWHRRHRKRVLHTFIHPTHPPMAPWHRQGISCLSAWPMAPARYLYVNAHHPPQPHVSTHFHVECWGNFA